MPIFISIFRVIGKSKRYYLSAIFCMNVRNIVLRAQECDLSCKRINGTHKTSNILCVRLLSGALNLIERKAHGKKLLIRTLVMAISLFIFRFQMSTILRPYPEGLIRIKIGYNEPICFVYLLCLNTATKAISALLLRKLKAFRFGKEGVWCTWCLIYNFEILSLV